ncbi:MAG: phosphotransferase [Candidatus Tectomicrobia bacterium]|uniref:Phosphotransferase n=1 Tax=Tectimicrobiota bacterium TaxID=2528274 RepID=A0A932CN97_UNCTE|nr:phosphotransferase [Candidatus Tectomicrobia bacterium]
MVGLSQENVAEMLAPIVGTPFPEWEIIPLVGGASDRRYFRILFGKPLSNGFRGGSSLILMKLAQAPSPPEIPYTNVLRHLQRHQIPVPQLYTYDPQKGAALLEDLGDRTLEEEVKRPTDPEAERAYYVKAIDLILRMQLEASHGKEADCVAFALAFDLPKLMEELEFFLTHTVAGLWQREISPAHRPVLQGQLLAICQILADQPRYFTHRDYHSRNIMVQAGDLRIVDFQDARMGPCQYDLVSLLRDSYVYLGEEWVEELMEYYVERKEALEGVRIDRQEFRRVFDLMALQRNLKALGTFGYQKVAKGNDRFLENIPLTLYYLQENLERNDSPSDLQELLRAYLPFEQAAPVHGPLLPQGPMVLDSAEAPVGPGVPRPQPLSLQSTR